MAYSKTSFSKFLKPTYLNYSFIEIILSILISISFILLSFFYEERNKNLRNFLVDIIHPLSRIISSPGHIINNIFEEVEYFTQIDEENEKLLIEISKYKEKLNELYYLKIENNQLQSLLNLTAPPASKKIAARIIIDPSNFASSNFFIDVGKKDEVKINNPVFNDSGLIGRIISVSDNTSEVLLITDLKSSLPVLSSKTNINFFVTGNNSGLEIKHIENPDILEDDEIILTTSSSGYFKEGIVVGKVKKSHDKTFIIPSASKNDSIFIKVLVYNYRKNQPNFSEK